ncbi:MAG: hypothetical protein V2A54_04905 [Bacteroidota bacterium]
MKKSLTLSFFYILFTSLLFSQTEFGSKSAWYMGAGLNTMLPTKKTFVYHDALIPEYAQPYDYQYTCYPKQRPGADFTLGRYFKLHDNPAKFSLGFLVSGGKSFLNTRYRVQVTEMISMQQYGSYYNSIHFRFPSLSMGIMGKWNIQNFPSVFASMEVSEHFSYYASYYKEVEASETFATLRLGFIFTKGKFSYSPFISMSKVILDDNRRDGFFDEYIHGFPSDKRNYLYPSIGMNVYYHHQKK